jgi:hypothetical protein
VLRCAKRGIHPWATHSIILLSELNKNYDSQLMKYTSLLNGTRRKLSFSFCVACWIRKHTWLTPVKEDDIYPERRSTALRHSLLSLHPVVFLK